MLDLSIESANQLYGWSNIALIFGAVAVLAGTIGVIWATGVRDRDADQRISQNEADTALAQSAAAKANEEAAKANERAEQARMRSAEANERAMKLEHDNLALRGQVATIETRAAEADTKLAKLTKRGEPRSINVDLVASALRGLPPIKVILLYPQSLPESANLAFSMRQALNKGGWKVVEYKAIPETNIWGYSLQGDIDFMARDLRTGAGAEPLRALMEVLGESGLHVSATNDGVLPDDTIRLIIFPKP